MKLRDVFELLILGAIWGASFLLQRVAAPEFGPLALVEVRVVIAALFLIALAASRGALSSLRGNWGAVFVLGTLNSAIPFTLFAFATLHLSAGFSAVLNATAPLFGALVGLVWLGERPSRMRALGLAVGFAGVVLLVTSKTDLRGARWAIAAGLAAALGYGISSHWTKKKLAGVHPLGIAAGGLIVASLLLAPLAAVHWPRTPVSTLSWWSAVALGVICTGLAYAIFFSLLERLGATRAMTVTYLIPMFAMVWGLLFLHEPVTSGMLTGGAVILTGVAIVARSSNVPRVASTGSAVPTAAQPEAKSRA